jgi:hypothetical protein
MRTTEERLRKIALIRIEIGNLRTFIRYMARLGFVDMIIRERLDTTALQLLLANTSILSLDLEVLRPLLTVPAAASRINNSLEAYTRGGMPPTMLDASARQMGEISLGQQLTLLDGLCAECDGRIETAIGAQPIVNTAVTAFATEMRRFQ